LRDFILLTLALMLLGLMDSLKQLTTEQGTLTEKTL